MMSPRSRTHFRTRAFWLLARLTWSVMLAAHGVWLVRSLGSSDAWLGQQFAMVLAVVFFALKTLDMRSLRWNLTRRGVVSCVVVVALLHAGAIERLSDGDDMSILWTLPVLAAVPLCMRLGVLAVIRRMLLQAAVLGHVPISWTPRFWHKYAGVLIRRHQQFLTALGTPRAPPASFLPIR